MMMGIGLAVVTLGAILRWAIDSTGDEFDLQIVGLILMVVGGIAFLTGAGLEFMKRRAALPPHMPHMPHPSMPGQPPAGAPQGYPPPPSYPHQPPAGAPQGYPPGQGYPPQPNYPPQQPPAGAPPSYPPQQPPAYKPPPTSPPKPPYST